MIFETILLILGLLIGFFLARYIISQQKWGDKADALNARWQKQIAELEKEYDVKLEKSNTLLEKLKQENKTNLEKFSKEWQIKYIQDIEELKKLFKESEKIIKLKSVSSSRRSLVGKFIEKFVPFLSKVPFAPSDMHFLGQPIDYIVFEGLREDKIRKVIFLEIKTGESKLTKREKSLKEAIARKKVYWKEIRVDTSDTKTPDKEIEREESAIEELYSKIDDKLRDVKTNRTDALKSSGNNENSIEEYKTACPKCEREFVIELDLGDDLGEGVKTTCPHCNKAVTITENDVW